MSRALGVRFSGGVRVQDFVFIARGLGWRSVSKAHDLRFSKTRRGLVGVFFVFFWFGGWRPFVGSFVVWVCLAWPLVPT